MPQEYVGWGDSWREHHPDWELRTWTDSSLPPLSHPEAFERCRNYGEASDVLRYEVLHRFGGVYVDTDVECLRSLEPLIADASAFAAWQRPDVIGSAVVGAVPEHPAIAEVLREVSEGAGSGNQVQTTGPGALTRVLRDAPDVTLFEHETFFPYDYWESPSDDAEGAAEGSYAIHHWHATWQSPRSLMRSKRKMKARLKRAQERQRRMRRKLRVKDRRLKAAAANKRELEQELARIRGSRWWRLGRRLAAVRRRLPGGRA